MQKGARTGWFLAATAFEVAAAVTLVVAAFVSASCAGGDDVPALRLMADGGPAAPPDAAGAPGVDSGRPDPGTDGGVSPYDAGTSPPPPPPPPGGDPCFDCEEARCAGTLAACEASPECIALIECGDACTDDACYEACDTAHPDGVAPYLAHLDCLDSMCATECGSGADPGGPGDPGGDACLACEETSCGAQLAACEGNPECAALLECGTACTDDACYEACDAAHPGGLDALYALLDCLDMACAAACGG